MNKVLLAAMTMPVALAVAAPASAEIILTQGFDDITTLASSGWVITNQSNPVGTIDWFQGNSAIFPGQSGGGTSYIGANFNSSTPGGQISDWLITPIFSTATGGVVTFWLRGDNDADYQDTIRTGFSTGSAATSAFTLSSIMVVPQSGWTQVNVSFAAAGAGTTGRFAIAYVGPEPSSNYIGVDTFSIATAAGAVPEPAAWAMMLVGFGIMGSAMRRRSTKVSFA